MDGLLRDGRRLSDGNRRETNYLRVHLINPSDTAFGTADITPRWLFVLAGATPQEFGNPMLCYETLEPLDVNNVAAGDVVGIGIHTENALRAYAIGCLLKRRDAFVIFRGIYATLYPEVQRTAWSGETET